LGGKGGAGVEGLTIGMSFEYYKGFLQKIHTLGVTIAKTCYCTSCVIKIDFWGLFLSKKIWLQNFGERKHHHQLVVVCKNN